MRLDKFICHATGISRPHAQRAVRGGQVTVNGALSRKADTQLRESDVVMLDGQVVTIPSLRYFMLNKPQGYVCATTDGEHPVVLDLLQENRLDDLQIAGRLDLDTTGLVLITDDGQWNHRVTAPARFCEKTYRVMLHDALEERAAQQLREGVMLHGETRATRPAVLDFIGDDNKAVRLTIHEGKYHQVKRMFAAVGNRVVGLHRERIGSIVLDATLAAGDYRELTAAEIASVS